MGDSGLRTGDCCLPGTTAEVRCSAKISGVSQRVVSRPAKMRHVSRMAVSRPAKKNLSLLRHESSVFDAVSRVRETRPHVAIWRGRQVPHPPLTHHALGLGQVTKARVIDPSKEFIHTDHRMFPGEVTGVAAFLFPHEPIDANDLLGQYETTCDHIAQLSGIPLPQDLDTRPRLLDTIRDGPLVPPVTQTRKGSLA